MEYRKHINQIIYSNCIKYNVLTNLIDASFKGSNDTCINIYIDLYNIVRSLYANKYQVIIEDYLSLASGIINLAGHYKAFFKYKYKVLANIYLIWSTNCSSINRKLIPNYNKEMYNRLISPMHTTIDDIINTNINILDLLCKYIPNIYFIHTQYESGVVMGYLINKNNSIPNLIISKDIYPYQLLSYYPNTYYLRPYKDIMNDNNDLSMIISTPYKYYNINTINAYWRYYCSTKNINNPYDKNITISPKNITNIMIFSGIIERSLYCKININTIMKMIYSIIEYNDIECSIESIYDKYNIEDKVSYIEMLNRYHVINIPYQVNTVYSNSNEVYSLKFEDNRDDESLRMICSKYFTKSPINLDKL